MLAPPSASSPRPSEMRASTSAASLGRLVTTAGRSPSRTSGTPAPRIAAVQEAGLAGRGGRGHPGVPRHQRVRAGAQPPAEVGQVARLDRPRQQRRGQPVELHEQHPGRRSRAGRGCRRTICRRVWPRNTSSLPASASQLTRAVRTAAVQLATHASSTLPTAMPSATRSAVNITPVCSSTPTSRTPRPPTTTATPNSTRRIRVPMRASRTASSTSAAGPPVAVTPGSSQNVAARTTTEVTPLRSSDLPQVTVSRQSAQHATRRSGPAARSRTTSRHASASSPDPGYVPPIADESQTKHHGSSRFIREGEPVAASLRPGRRARRRAPAGADPPARTHCRPRAGDGAGATQSGRATSSCPSCPSCPSSTS